VKAIFFWCKHTFGVYYIIDFLGIPLLGWSSCPYISILLCIISDRILVTQSDTSMPISYPMIMEFLSSYNVLFLFSACFHALGIFHSVLNLNSCNNEMPIARSRFFVTLLKMLGDRCWLSRVARSSSRQVLNVRSSAPIFFFVVLYHSWRILTHSLFHSHKLC